MLLPIILTGLGALCCLKHGKCERALIVLAWLGLLPVAKHLLAVKHKSAGEEEAAAKQRHYAVSCQMVEIFFGVLPQLCLQLFILGKYGEYDEYAGFRYAIGAEALFVIYGVVNFLQFGLTTKDNAETEASYTRGFVIWFFFLPWSVMFVLSCVPLFLFSSLYFDGSLNGYIAVIIYFFFHLFACALFFSLLPEVEGKGYCEINVLIVLGVLFSYASWSFSSFWFVSLMPALDPDKKRLFSLLPEFIWPHSTSYFEQWIEWGEGKPKKAGGARCAFALECGNKVGTVELH